MTYVVAFINDNTFEEPHIVLGVSEGQVAALVRRYLYTAGVRDNAGALIPIDPRGDGSMMTLQEQLMDCDDVDVLWFSTQVGQADGDIMAAGTFDVWIKTNADALRQQHAPAVVDVITTL